MQRSAEATCGRTSLQQFRYVQRTLVRAMGVRRIYTGGVEAYVHDAVLDMQGARRGLLQAVAEVTAADAWSHFVPYGDRTAHDVLAHLAGADHAWAVAARGLLKGEGEERPPPSPEHVRATRQAAIARARTLSPDALLDEMARRRKLLISLYELLEPRHLALALQSFGERHNSARERIWLGYHDRLHADDLRRALATRWHPQRLTVTPELGPALPSLAPDETLYVVYSVDPVAWEQPSCVRGWTNRQLLAHISVGDWMAQRHLRSLIDHGVPAPWPDIDAENARLIDEREHVTTRRLIDDYLSMRHETLRLYARLTPELLAVMIPLPWRDNEQVPVRDMFLGFGRHEEHHREQLRPAMRYARARGGGG